MVQPNIMLLYYTLYDIIPNGAPSYFLIPIFQFVSKGGGLNQKLMLFNLGKATSGAPIILGTNQLPKPPNKAGITMNNNIIIP